MALPTPVIEKLTQRPSSTQGWFGQLTMFAVTVFAISLGIYLGLEFAYKPYLNSRIAKLDEEIKKFSVQIPQGDQDKIIEFYSQLANLKKVLTGRLSPVPVLKWAEDHTLPAVSLGSFNYQMRTRQMMVHATGRTLSDVSQQIRIFQEAEEVRQVTVNSISQVGNSGAWQFDATIIFKNTFPPGQVILSTPAASSSASSSLPTAASSTVTSTVPAGQGAATSTPR
jgi:hypothetical protein